MANSVRIYFSEVKDEEDFTYLSHSYTKCGEKPGYNCKDNESGMYAIFGNVLVQVEREL